MNSIHIENDWHLVCSESRYIFIYLDLILWFCDIEFSLCILFAGHPAFVCCFSPMLGSQCRSHRGSHDFSSFHSMYSRLQHSIHLSIHTFIHNHTCINWCWFSFIHYRFRFWYGWCRHRSILFFSSFRLACCTHCAGKKKGDRFHCWNGIFSFT